MLHLEVRKKAGGAEVLRLAGSAVTVGASSGNEVVVRARGVAGRHMRILERDGGYFVDLFKGVEPVAVNGRAFLGGPVALGDRITIGEATITLLAGRPMIRATPVGEIPVGDTAGPPQSVAVPGTEIEYRAMRLAACAILRGASSAEEAATQMVDFLDRELPPVEWAIGFLAPGSGFRPLASTFRETPAVPPRLLEGIASGENLARSDTVAGVLTLVAEPYREGDTCVGVLVRESPRLAARAVLLLEEVARLSGLAFGSPSRSGEPASTVIAIEPVSSPAESAAEGILRQTDDLKKIVETVEREVIDRAMRRVEGNQSRGAQILNISRGSLIAKLKDFDIPDYRYLRRERRKS